MAEETTIDLRNVRDASRIFAEAFSQAGLLGTASGGISAPGALDRFREEEERSRAQERSTKTLLDFIDVQDEINSTGVATEANARRRNQLEQTLQRDSILLGNSFTDVANAITENTYDQIDIDNFINDGTLREITQNTSESIATAGNSLSDKIREVGKNLANESKSFFSSYFGKFSTGLLFVKAADTAVEDYSSSWKYGTDLVQSSLEKQANATLLGLKNVDLNELDAKNRVLVNSLGGAVEFQKTLKENSHAYFSATGELEESTRFSVQMLETFRKSGAGLDNVLLSSKGKINDLGIAFDDIRKLGGETFAEQSAALQEYSETEEVRTKLIAANNAEQRRNILRTRVETKKLLLNMGLTSDQAKAAADSLSLLGGKSAKDRLKNSIKTESILSAMGIDNAEIFAKAQRLGGVEFLNAAEKKLIPGILSELEKVRAETTVGDPTQDFLNSGLIDKLGDSGALELSKKFGELQLTDERTAKAITDSANKRVTGVTTVSGVDKVIENTLFLKDIAKLALDNNQVLTSILGAITGLSAILGIGLITMLGAVALPIAAIIGVAGLIDALTGGSFIRDMVAGVMEGIASFFGGKFSFDSFTDGIFDMLTGKETSQDTISNILPDIDSSGTKSGGRGGAKQRKLKKSEDLEQQEPQEPQKIKPKDLEQQEPQKIKPKDFEIEKERKMSDILKDFEKDGILTDEILKTNNMLLKSNADILEQDSNKTNANLSNGFGDIVNIIKDQTTNIKNQTELQQKMVDALNKTPTIYNAE